MLVDARSAQREINRDIFFQLPDRANESGSRLKTSDVAFVKDFPDRAHGPVMRAFADQTDKEIGVLSTGQRRCGVEMQSTPLPSLRDNAGKACPGAMLVADAGQQKTELRRNAGARLVLQDPLAQHAFQKGPVSRQARAAKATPKTVSDIALDGHLPAGGKAVIEAHRRCEQRALRSDTQIFGRTELDLQLPYIGDSRISTVKRTVGYRRGGADRDERQAEHKACPASHGLGRNTQIAAGSEPAARTATKSLSSSGTNNPVRAPGAVPTWPMR